MKITDREGNEMTKEQVIQKTINLLAGISVPVMMDHISGPIRLAVENLQVVLRAIEEEKIVVKDPKQADGPKLELVPEERQEEPKEAEEAGE